MKTLLFFLLLSSPSVFAQSNHESKQKLNDCNDSLEAKNNMVRNLADELIALQINSKNTSDLLLRMRDENEKLREIMRDYVRQIDELNTKNVQLATELDKCSEK